MKEESRESCFDLHRQPPGVIRKPDFSVCPPGEHPVRPDTRVNDGRHVRPCAHLDRILTKTGKDDRIPIGDEVSIGPKGIPRAERGHTGGIKGGITPISTLRDRLLVSQRPVLDYMDAFVQLSTHLDVSVQLWQALTWAVCFCSLIPIVTVGIKNN